MPEGGGVLGEGKAKQVVVRQLDSVPLCKASPATAVSWPLSRTPEGTVRLPRELGPSRF